MAGCLSAMSESLVLAMNVLRRITPRLYIGAVVGVDGTCSSFRVALHRVDVGASAHVIVRGQRLCHRTASVIGTVGAPEVAVVDAAVESAGQRASLTKLARQQQVQVKLVKIG